MRRRLRRRPPPDRRIDPPIEVLPIDRPVKIDRPIKILPIDPIGTRPIDPPIGILPIGPPIRVHPVSPPETEKFSVSQTTEGVITTPNVDLINHAIRFSFAPIWRYQVPVGTQVIFRPGDRFYLHIRDGAGTEWGDEQEVQIVFWNAVKREMRVVFTGFYMDVKEPTDIDRMATYQITQPHIVPGGGWIYIEGFAPIAPHTIDSAVSHFSLETQRVRQRI